MSRSHCHYRNGKRSPEVCSWQSMIYRCTSSNSVSAKNYKDRGITVCKKWLKFEGFLEDMGMRPEGTTLDRIDNDGNYEPGNCRWASAKDQHRNTRVNTIIKHNGESKCIAQWSDDLGISINTIQSRQQRGWPKERLLEKVQTQYSHKRKGKK